MSPSASETHYSILGVTEEATAEDIKKAYRERALKEHPDKGGDDARFHELAQAYAVLEDEKRRSAYDDELQKAREHDTLVEGGRSSSGAVGPDVRVKTAPTPGSTRSKKKEAASFGEWKPFGTARTVLKALTDDVAPEAATEALFQKFKALPRGKEQRREWLGSLRGEQKQALKARAKEHEKAEREKWQKWLHR